MKKIITILGALAVAGSPTIVLRNIAPHQTQKVQNVFTKTSNGLDNSITDTQDTDYNFNFKVTLSNSDYNGFSGFLDQIAFNLSDYNYHAWPVYLFQWLDDDDFHTGPFPGLNSHTKQGFFHDPMVWANRLENHMGHFGEWRDDKSDTAFYMATCWGQWGSFGQTVDNQWNADRAASKPLSGIIFNFGFTYSVYWHHYTTVAPSFQIIMA